MTNWIFWCTQWGTKHMAPPDGATSKRLDSGATSERLYSGAAWRCHVFDPQLCQDNVVGMFCSVLYFDYLHLKWGSNICCFRFFFSSPSATLKNSPLIFFIVCLFFIFLTAWKEAVWYGSVLQISDAAIKSCPGLRRCVCWVEKERHSAPTRSSRLD